MPHPYQRCSLENWRRLWKELGSTANVAPAWVALTSHYTKPDRKYHNLNHVVHCLEIFDTVRKQFNNPSTAELVLWYHDVIYDTHAHNNEEASLAYLLEDLTSLLPKVKLPQVKDLIIATKHQVKAKGDAALVQDIDLSILGADPVQFETYDRAIQQEYHWVDAATYKSKRTEVLKTLSKPPIFNTPVFRAKYETAAAQNLAQTIQKLEKKL